MPNSFPSCGSDGYDGHDPECQRIGGYVPVSREALAFSRMTDPYLGDGVGVRITKDGDGPNSVVQLYRTEGGESILFGKLVVHPIPTGATVSLKRENEPTIRLWGPTWQEITGGEHADIRQSGCDDWVVTVDGEEILRVPFVESLPPVPPIPLKTRIIKRIREFGDKVRRLSTDRLAAKLGYTRTGECDHDDYY